MIAMLFLLSACVPTNHRVKITKDEYVINHKSILLTELYFPKGLGHKHEARELIESNVRQLFKDNGITIYEPDVFKKELEAQKLALGGVYDSETGEYNNEKGQLAEDNALKALREKLGITSVLFYDVRVKGARLDNFRAKWDGREEIYEANNSELNNVLSAMFVTTHGHIAALSLTVFLHDMNNTEMYYGAGGIQLVHKIDDNDKFIPVPVEQLMTNEQQLKFSINEAFRRLFELKRIYNREIDQI